MSCCPKNPLRPLTTEERQRLERMARARSEPVEQVVRAQALLAVVSGHCYTEAACLAGYHSGDTVSALVRRFNERGMRALETQPGRGRKATYSVADRARMVAEVGREPDPAQEGTATWSLMTLRQALRRAPDGLPAVSTYTLRAVLQASGLRYTRSRTWCDTGTAVRRRKSGLVTVTDPDAVAKKT